MKTTTCYWIGRSRGSIMNTMLECYDTSGSKSAFTEFQQFHQFHHHYTGVPAVSAAPLSSPYSVLPPHSGSVQYTPTPTRSMGQPGPGNPHETSYNNSATSIQHPVRHLGYSFPLNPMGNPNHHQAYTHHYPTPPGKREGNSHVVLVWN